MYWEARGEGRRGMIAVGWTVLNRVKNPLFPSTPCAVIHQGGERPPCQFSYWCDGKSDRPRDLPSWRSALKIAAKLLSHPPPDPTGGALYFHNRSVRTPRHHVRTARIGAHVFYR
ncbi:MAG TPA: cell wall hydrolase [Gammaproteobacteria bacterium]|nr:cell wall hydrolase [Gammaproteobacteria bacterium]